MKASKTHARARRQPRKTAAAKGKSQAPDLTFELEGFAGNLDTARTLWRSYPELVEAPDFPEPFLSASGGNVGCGILGEEELLEAGILKAGQATDEQKRFKMPTPKELRAKLQSVRDTLAGSSHWSPEAEREFGGYLRSIVDLPHDDERNFIRDESRDSFTGENQENQRKDFVASRRNVAIEFLAICRVIHYAYDDENAPGENLIERLVFDYLHKGGLRPEGVQELVDDFVRSFEWELGRARRTIDEYPDLFTPEALEKELV